LLAIFGNNQQKLVMWDEKFGGDTGKDKNLHGIT